MKPMRLFMILISLSFAICATVKADDEERPRIDTKHYHLFDGIDLIYATNVDYARPKILIKTIFPKLVTESESEIDYVDAFNQAVDNLIHEEVAAFKKQVQENLPTQINLPKSMRSNEMHIDFDVSAINTNKIHIVSVRFSIQEYIGGMAHPKHFHRVLNFDIDNNKILSLDEIFAENADYLTVISEYSKKVLSRHLQNLDMVEEGTKAVPKNFENWNIKSEGLLFTFDDYQVAPYVEGTQTTLVPYRFLEGMIPKSSPIVECVQKPRRCSRNSLLTGGFIDEALNTRHSSLNPILS